jgi:hypothetical protein
MVRKIFLIVLLVSFGGTGVALCAEKLDAITWHAVQTYDVAALQKIEDLEIGKFVGLRCHFRSKRIQHIKINWYEATLWQHTAHDPRKPFSYIRVQVSRKDLPAFESLPSDFESGTMFTIYGEVQKDSHSTFVRLIGRKVVLARDRSATVSW